MTKTRERTSEVVIVSNDTFRISVYFADKSPFPNDTIELTGTTLFGDDERILIGVVASKGQNLYKFGLETPNTIRLALCLLERHDASIYDALTK